MKLGMVEVVEEEVVVVAGAWRGKSWECGCGGEKERREVDEGGVKIVCFFWVSSQFLGTDAKWRN